MYEQDVIDGVASENKYHTFALCWLLKKRVYLISIDNLYALYAFISAFH